MRQTKIYCSFCGQENKIEDLTCRKCHRFLERGDHPLIDYMENKIKGKFDGEVQNTFFSILKNYIKSHLYGFIMTCSIFASATAMIVTGITNDHSEIHYVEEKFVPQEKQVTYQGEGLTSIDVARKYIDAIESGDMDIVKGLQLETFYPEVLEEIKKYQEENQLERYISPALTHHLFDNRDIYFKMNETIEAEEDSHYYLGDSELIIPHQEYAGYRTDDYMLGLWYCSNHTCSRFQGRIHGDFSPNIEIQVISIEGKNYILGEKVATYMGQNEEVYHMALFRSEGDTTNLNFDEALREFDDCYDDKACVLQHDFNHRNILEELPASQWLLEK